MSSTARRLYTSLRLLPRPTAPQGRAQWYVVREGRRWQGPFDAAEVAFQIHSGEAGAHDEVAHARSRRRYVVGQTPFLARWLERSPERDRRLVQGLLKVYRSRLAHKKDELPTWALDLALTDDQRRAFDLLELEPSCDLGELRRRHRALALRHHPDRGGDSARMEELNWAYSVARHAVDNQL